MRYLFLLAISVGAFAFGGPPFFDGNDGKRKQIPIRLEPWARGFSQVTDIQFHPDNADRVFVLEKPGKLWAVSRKNPSERSQVLKLGVLTSSEMGLLGLTFHPQFAKNRRIYLNYNPSSGTRRTRVSEWTLSAKGIPEKERVLLEVLQPYPNHKAGQLGFGPDGMLFVGLGDGGFADDPHNNGQNPKALLGKMLRIDVDKGGKKPYGVPKDNPFVSNKDFAPEIWAWGLRNPWRYSFDPSGRMIVADVGQNKWEEVTIVSAGENHGWRIKEASHCFKPSTGCDSKGLSDPWLEYGRDDGASITGGFVYTGKSLPGLKGKYLFADFVSGRIWAADLPAKGEEHKTTTDFFTLGRWSVQPSTFGRDLDGEVYVGDFVGGTIYRVSPP